MDSDNKVFFVRVQHIFQALLSLYGAAASYQAVVRLQKYESTAEKLADWSSEAARQLHKTRTTQTSGALVVIASLVSSVTLSAGLTLLPTWARRSVSPVMLVAVLATRHHMSGYWAPGDGKTVGTRVPLPNMEDYNEAQRRTEKLLKILEYLEYSWLITSLMDNALAH